MVEHPPEPYLLCSLSFYTMPMFRSTFCILFCCLSYLACQVQPSESKQENKPSFKDEAYYLQLSNNSERLCALRSGLFAQYLVNATDSSGPWMAQGDSVMMYIRQVGEPNRDGYWLLVQQFLSSLPSQPLVTWLEKVEKISRDSFGTWPTAWPQEEYPSFLITSQTEFSLEDYDIDLKKRIDTKARPPHYIFVRKDAAHFQGYSQLIPPIQKDAKTKYHLRQAQILLQPARTDMYALYFDQDTVQQEKRRNFMLRKSEEEFSQIRAHYLQE